MPAWYPELLASVTRQVNAGRSKAIAAANQELLASYWAIGRELAQREAEQGWGCLSGDPAVCRIPRRHRILTPKLALHEIFRLGLA